MQEFLHVLGICPDHLSHHNLLEYLSVYNPQDLVHSAINLWSNIKAKVSSIV